MKDIFSIHADKYSKFRPVFPDELFELMALQAKEHELAWDVATGNGQAATRLAKYFKKVVATDISIKQLSHAEMVSNIEYRLEPAEKSSLLDASVDLVTISQALHWLDFDKFYAEVRRVTKPGGLVAAFVYTLIRVEDQVIDKLITKFYYEESALWWDDERKYVDDAYETIPFPFKEEPMPRFSIKYRWSLDQLVGYLRTWSANHHYQRNFGKPLVDDKLLPSLQTAWNKDEVEVTFPVAMRVGRL